MFVCLNSNATRVCRRYVEAQAEAKYAWMREQCKNEGEKVADACAGPWEPEAPAGRPDFFGKAFAAAVHSAAARAPAPADPAAACKAAGAEMKQACGDSYAAIAADLAAGKITEAEATQAYADAAETCKEAGKKIADACAGPWGPKPPPSFLAKLTGAAPFPDPAKVGRCKLNSRLVSFDPCLERRLVGFNS